MKTLRAYLSTLLIAALVITSLPVAAAPGAPQSMDLVSTQSVLAGDRAGADREKSMKFWPVPMYRTNC